MNASISRWAPVAVAIAVFAFYVATQTAGVRSDTTDWAMYVMHARNLVEGLPYTATGYVFQPESSTEVGANSYPSGFSLLIAPLIAARGIDIPMLKVMTAAFLAFSLVPTYWLARRVLPVAPALGIMAFLAFSMPFLYVYDLIGSDAPYQVVSLLVLLQVQRTFDEGWNETRPWRSGMVAGVGISVSYLFRPFGLAILLAVGSLELLKRRRVTAFHLAVLLAFIPFAAMNNLAFHRDDSYAYQFTLAPQAILQHVVANLKLVSYAFANPLGHQLRYALWGLTLPLMVWAYVTRVRRGPQVTELYIFFMAGVLAVYWDTNYRYLVPLLPFCAVYLAEGVRDAAGRLAPRWRQPVVTAVAATLLLAPALNAALLRPDPQQTLVTAPAYEALAERVRRDTPATAYVVFWNPRVLALSTDRRSSGWPADSSTAHIQAWLHRIGATHVIADSHSAKGDGTLLALSRAAPGEFLVEYTNEQFTLMKVLPPDASR